LLYATILINLLTYLHGFRHPVDFYHTRLIRFEDME